MTDLKIRCIFSILAFLSFFPNFCFAAEDISNKDLIIIGSGFGSLTAAVVLCFFFYKKHVEKKWQDFSRELGMNLLYCHVFKPDFALSGELKGRKCRIMTLREMRKSYQYRGKTYYREVVYTRVKLWAKTCLKIDFKLETEGISDKIKKKLGDCNEIEIGSQKFDSAFLIKCSIPCYRDNIVHIMTPRVQEEILDTKGLFASDRYKVEVKGDLIEIDCSSHSIMHIRKMLDAAQSLAESMEEYGPII